jgi:hypothetical protein
MKFIYITLTFIILCISLEARENPFEATSAFVEEKQRILEIEQDYAYEFQKKDSEVEVTKTQEVKPVVEKTSKKVNKPKVVIKKVDQESKIKKLIKSIEKQLPAKKDEIDIETMNVEPEIMPEVAIEKVVAKEVYNPTSFIKIINYEDRIEIHTNYKVFKKFDLNDENKIVLDYHAKVNFYTQKIDLNSKYFNKIIVGNHKKEKYFRIVIKTKNHPSLYKVTHKNDMVIIYKGE